MYTDPDGGADIGSSGSTRRRELAQVVDELPHSTSVCLRRQVECRTGDSTQNIVFIEITDCPQQFGEQAKGANHRFAT